MSCPISLSSSTRPILSAMLLAPSIIADAGAKLDDKLTAIVVHEDRSLQASG